MSEDGTNPVLFDELSANKSPADGVMTPGAQMARQRQSLGWTVAEAANHLNLAPRQIQAIEDDNHAALPGIAITRGFIRAYAKLLRMDPVPLMAKMATLSTDTIGVTDGAPARRTLPPAHFSESRTGSVRSHRAASKWYSALLFAVAVIGGVSLAQHFGWIPNDLETASAKVSDGLTNLRGSGSAGVEGAATTLNADTTTTPGHVEIIPETPALLAPGATAPNAAAVSALVPATTAAIPVFKPELLEPAGKKQGAVATPVAGSNKLVLNLRSDSWIEIRGAGKDAVASKLYRAGTTETFDISEPVLLVVGNASGVDATLRGAPLELQETAKNNVARLNLK
ncbi:RodZ domain-containing protein [Actimicrobium antarcticum]|uniref:Helix-turn-helix domain-containing protein n=1 Tax=Actimicrobium antarcticum TaxID=1051899 RepID=A0ABP7U1T5_9BURK